MKFMKLLVAAVGVSGLWAGAAGAATIPYSETFDSYAAGTTSVPNFERAGATTYTIVQQAAADNAYQAVTSANSGSAAISFSNVPSGSGGLVVSTNVKLVSAVAGTTGPAANFGLGLFGSTADFSNTAGGVSQYRLLFGTLASNVGQLFVVRNGTNQTPLSNTIPVTIGGDYTLTAEVSLNPNNTLTIHGVITDGTNTAQLTYTDASPLTGTYFGYRTATAGAGTSETVEYDNFSVTLAPEPGAIGLVGVAGVMLGRRRR